ncbi:MAG TPA: hypothetical protein VFP91_00295 [Vicinamibacterales bacterium]|nr:hypothetical protein [Vicinamibacterales bacterium]
MSFRSLKVALAGALFLGLSAAAPTSATSDLSHLTYVTFQRSVMLPGDVQLAPGTYRFELATSPGMGLVRVSSRDLETVYLMAYTSEVERPNNGDREAIVTLSKSSLGAMPSITAWYPLGDSVGHQFVYSN